VLLLALVCGAATPLPLAVASPPDFFTTRQAAVLRPPVLGRELLATARAVLPGTRAFAWSSRSLSVLLGTIAAAHGGNFPWVSPGRTGWSFPGNSSFIDTSPKVDESFASPEGGGK